MLEGFTDGIKEFIKWEVSHTPFRPRDPVLLSGICEDVRDPEFSHKYDRNKPLL